MILFALACADNSIETAEEFTEELMFVPISEDGISVEEVDPNRYLGLWYEIATTPSSQQRSCTGTTAEYSLIDDQTVGVLNRCYLGSLDGQLNAIQGVAYVQDETYARLMVDFDFGFTAPYNIITLDGNANGELYQFAVVSSYTNLWILSESSTRIRNTRPMYGYMV